MIFVMCCEDSGKIGFLEALGDPANPCIGVLSESELGDLLSQVHT